MTKEELSERESQAEKVKSRLRHFIEWYTTSIFYKNGVLKVTDKMRDKITKAYLNHERYDLYNYVPEDLYNEADWICRDVINKYFEECHIASYSASVLFKTGLVIFYAQTKPLMIKAIASEQLEKYNQNLKIASELFNKYENRSYRIGKKVFIQNVNQRTGDMFAEASTEEKELINKVYLDLVSYMILENDILDGDTSNFRNKGKPILEKWEWWYCSKEIPYRECVKKYFEKLFDMAAKEISEIWKTHVNGVELRSGAAALSKEAADNIVDFSQVEVISEEDDYDEENGLELDANAFLDEWEDTHDTAPTYEDVLDYCSEPEMVDAIYNIINTGNTSYKNEEEYAKLLWEAIQELLL